MDHLTIADTNSDKTSSISKAVSNESVAGKFKSFIICYTVNICFCSE